MGSRAEPDAHADIDDPTVNIGDSTAVLVGETDADPRAFDGNDSDSDDGCERECQ